MTSLSPQLRHVVHQTVALLGEVLREKTGLKTYARIENLRKTMASLRGRKDQSKIQILNQELKNLSRLDNDERKTIARAFTLMLECMNACENAYRSHKIGLRRLPKSAAKPDRIIYVLTAHPTEARSPENIALFREILKCVQPVFSRDNSEFTSSEKEAIRHGLDLAWLTSVERRRKPRVHDEAEHIYSLLLNQETVSSLIEASREIAPVYIRSWVGGDKDGHSGVDEKTFTDSLGLSRRHLIDISKSALQEVKATLKRTHEWKSLHPRLKRVEVALMALRTLKAGDGRRVRSFRSAFTLLRSSYEELIGTSHPKLTELKRLLHIFPALVVPLEFRESSDVLMKNEPSSAISRMMAALGQVSEGGEPLWYVRGFIISMASELKHMKAAARIVTQVFGEIKIPVIPLFEQSAALQSSTQIVREMLADSEFRKAISQHWHSRVEIMVGYSDSSKESGVLFSRLKINENMRALDRLFQRHRTLTPIFFQGSGGSVDRGGGTILEQTAWWPSGALRNYKVTVQGEMVERSLATPEIIRGQLERIALSASRWPTLARKPLAKPDQALEKFAASVATHYRETLRDPDFLKLIEFVTPYRFLDRLKFGSRPSKRSTKVSLEGLRAIPWILCWTQTRTLFPTWWGVGRAWEKASSAEKRKLKTIAKRDPLFQTYVRALGFTLAKVELSVFAIYLQESALPQNLKSQWFKEFRHEYALALKFARAVLDSKDLIAWRPWLKESIDLRSPMIHPLNLLQILAIQDREIALLRLTAVGISSGMMATG